MVNQNMVHNCCSNRGEFRSAIEGKGEVIIRQVTHKAAGVSNYACNIQHLEIIYFAGLTYKSSNTI